MDWGPKNSTDASAIVYASISIEQNENLIRVVSVEEIEEATKDINLNKALSPDGFSPFFQEFCFLIRKEVIDAT